MLTWTTARPTQPGWYAYRWPDATEQAVLCYTMLLVEDDVVLEGLGASTVGDLAPSSLEDFHGEWLGPLTLDALAGDCALCHGLTPQPGDTIEEFLDDRHEALPANTECHCGAWLDEHTAQHPHGCASSNCRGWRAREEGT